MFTQNNHKDIGKFGLKNESKENMSAASNRVGTKKRTRAESTICEGDIPLNATSLHLQMDIQSTDNQNQKYSNSAGLPSTQNQNRATVQNLNIESEIGAQILDLRTNLFSTKKFAGLSTKQAEKEHYCFLNEMRDRLNIDSEKLIDLEARITCK